MTGDRSRPRAVWVSGAFGFGDELAYFRQVIAQFAERLPGSAVLVREGYPTERYPELPLHPIMKFWVMPRNRGRAGYVYTGNLRIPTPAALWRLLRTPADVVVVVEFTPTALLAAAAARLGGRRRVHLIESDPSFRGGGGGRGSRVIKRLAIRGADVVLVSNAAAARYAIDSLKVRASRLRIGPYLTSQPQDPQSGRDEGGAVRFLFLNSLQRRKGLHLLLDALGELSELGEPSRAWTLDVVGDGPERGRLEAQARAAGLGDRVRFHGQIPHQDVGEHYARAHVVICPTLGDYRSLAGFEAVNARRPVVLSTLDGAASEITAATRSAVVIDPRDTTAFARELRTLLDDRDELRRRLTVAASPPNGFSLESVGANLERAVRAAARGAE